MPSGVIVIRAGARPTRQGPADWFTGTVWVDEVVARTPPSRLRAVRVSFAPGARTAWHTHPVGQVLHVLSGSGFVQRSGSPAEPISPGDTVMIAPDERHWHGAGPDQLFVHLAMHESGPDGTDVVWAEAVAEDEYRQATAR